MKARELIGGAAYSPNELTIMWGAFDDAWAEVCPDVSTRASAIESARSSLASIVLSLSSMGHVERNGLRAAAAEAFRFKHRIGD
jgi:hypothetical protein